MSSINTYAPPQLTRHIEEILSTTDNLLGALAFGYDVPPTIREALIYHATEEQLVMVKKALHEHHRLAARNAADRLLQAAAEAQAYA